MHYINTASGQYPVTEREIKLAYPNVSFSQPFVAPEPYALVFEAPRPEHDAVTQTVRDIAPVLTNKGHYEQQWEVVLCFVEYTDEEGALHTVSEQEAAAIEMDRKSKVPTTISIRQAKLALLQAGLLDDVEAAIVQADRAIQIEWEYAIEFKRDWPTLLALQPILGLTDRQIDDLFVLASTL